MARFLKAGRTDTFDGARTKWNTDWRVILYQATVVVDDDTVAGGITEATFSGYARLTPTFPASALDGSYNAASTAPQCQFAHNGGGTANTIQGWGVINNVTGVLVEAEDFDNHQLMATAQDLAYVTLTATLGPP